MEKQICMCLYVVVPLYHPAKIGVYWYPITVAMNIPAPIFHLNSACKLMPTTGSHRHFILSWSTARLFGCSIQNTSNDLTLGPSLWDFHDESEKFTWASFFFFNDQPHVLQGNSLYRCVSCWPDTPTVRIGVRRHAQRQCSFFFA